MCQSAPNDKSRGVRTVLAGHGRARVGQQIGLQEVPIIRLARLSETQARAFRIADNRLTDSSTWVDKKFLPRPMRIPL